MRGATIEQSQFRRVGQTAAGGRCTNKANLERAGECPGGNGAEQSQFCRRCRPEPADQFCETKPISGWWNAGEANQEIGGPRTGTNSWWGRTHRYLSAARPDYGKQSQLTQDPAAWKGRTAAVYWRDL